MPTEVARHTENSSPYLVEAEVTEFTKEQCDWLLSRFTRRED